MKMISKDREYREFNFNIVGDETDMIIEGVPIVFNQRTLIGVKDGVEIYEMISPNAFDGAIIDDVVFVENHDGTPGARTRNKSLELEFRPNEVYMRANLKTSSKGPSIYSDVKNGIYDRMSFSFSVLKKSFDKVTRTRVIEKIGKLYDVSVVSFAAYEQTSVLARSNFEAEADEIIAEAVKTDEMRKRLELLCRIENMKGKR